MSFRSRLLQGQNFRFAIDFAGHYCYTELLLQHSLADVEVLKADAAGFQNCQKYE